MTPDEKAQQLLEQRREEAEKEIHEALNKIFRKPIRHLSDYDKAFIKARVSYLTKEQKETYAEVLKEEIKDPNKEAREAEEKELEVLTRKELEEIATKLQIPEDLIKKAKKNADLQELIEQRKEALEAEEKEE